MSLDWGDGSYELTAKGLEPATHAALAALEPVAGLRLLDLGCGTGNAALEASRRGAQVTAVDPAARLVEVTRARAAAAGLAVAAVTGEAGQIPAAAGAFDAAVSVFAVIFAPAAEAAAAELIRVVRPGGAIVLTAWLPEGPIFQAGMLLRRALSQVLPASPVAKAPRWGEQAFVQELFAGHRVDCTKLEIVFEVASIEAWFAEQESHHPVWRAGRRMLDAAAWSTLRDESIAAMRAAASDPRQLVGSYAQYVIVRS